jgi:hypothetical protein
MKTFLIGLILSTLPIINFVLIYFWSKKNNVIDLFKKNRTCYYGDLFFIFFNFFLPYSIVINWKLIYVLLLISIILNIIMHFYYMKIHKKENNKVFLFNNKLNKISGGGFIHLIFSTIQTILIFIFILSEIKSNIFYVASVFLLGYFVFGIPFSKKIHNGKVLLVDLMICGFGFCLIILKILLSSI